MFGKLKIYFFRVKLSDLEIGHCLGERWCILSDDRAFTCDLVFKLKKNCFLTFHNLCKSINLQFVYRCIWSCIIVRIYCITTFYISFTFIEIYFQRNPIWYSISAKGFSLSFHIVGDARFNNKQTVH